jgi:hypothetical protein
MALLRPHAINPTFVGLKSLAFSAGLTLHCSNRSATLTASDGVCWAEQGPGQDHRHNHNMRKSAL